MHITIAAADTTQMPQILHFLEALFIELGEERASLDFLTPSLIESLLESGKTWAFLAKVAHKPVGLLTLTESQAAYAGGAYGVMDELYVLPEFRSHQVGKALIEQAKTIAQQRGWKRIAVTAPTDKKWHRTVQFYEKNGFTFTGPKLKWVIEEVQ